ncbi:UPF0057 membrane protein At4g30660-like [Hibiscus syriacus]|uniref:UPF0057 membrane protein At4g30660-like n=1 Tax=Hibiscus syriacus TaxID=106335 RepID=UPI0019247429|nr:UPF0057 membrane protein At4g30660-like [Hibiscus syriacus]
MNVYLHAQNDTVSTQSRFCTPHSITILLPPLGVYFHHGCCSVEFFICLVLTILGYIPDIIYALYGIIFVNCDEYFDDYLLLILKI